MEMVLTDDTDVQKDLDAMLSEIDGEDSTSSTVEPDQSAMPDQEETDKTDSKKGEMPEKKPEEEDVQQNTDKTDEGNGDKPAAWKPPETVPYDQFSKVRRGSRKVERTLHKTTAELNQIQKEKAELEAKLRYFENIAKQDEYEIPEYHSEITPELLNAAEEGDMQAQAQINRINAEKLQANNQEVDTQQGDTWIDHANDDIKDVIDDWLSDESDAGIARMGIAEEVERSLANDPTINTLSADQIGEKIINETNARFAEASKQAVQDKVSIVESKEKQIPESLSSGTGESTPTFIEIDDLEGEELEAALKHNGMI